MDDFRKIVRESLLAYFEVLVELAQNQSSVELFLMHIGKASGVLASIQIVGAMESQEERDSYKNRLEVLIDLWNVKAEIDNEN